MTCAEWEIRIASEEAGIEAHIAACEACRLFASELELNHAAMLDDTDINPSAMHARVLSSFGKPRWIYAVAAGFLLAVLAYSILAGEPKAIEPIAFQFPVPRAPEVKVSTRAVVVARRPPAQQAAVIKIVTDDPDVVILLVDSTGGL